MRLIVGAIETATNVGLNAVTSSTKRGKVAIAHGFADAVGEEPRGLILHLKDAAEPVRAVALLAGHHEVN